ncbi:MAG: hypothetical protein R3Y63_02620 [Eubacteriales bacterium]
MKTCDICGNLVQEGFDECPKCKKIAEGAVLPQSSSDTENLTTCPDCGNHLEKGTDRCPHCLEIRRQESPSNQPGGKSFAEKEADRKAALMDTPVEQIIIPGKKNANIAVFAAIGLIVVAIIAFVVLGIL